MQRLPVHAARHSFRCLCSLRLNHADLNNAVKVLERLREAVENMRWRHEGLKVTISIGACQRDDEEASEFIKSADALLYKAKKNGKNRIEH